MPLAFPAHAADMSQIRQPGWEAMCLRNDQPINFCRSFSGPKQISHTPELAAAISRINDGVNSEYRFQSDSRSYGVSDYWTVPTGGTADCEDYVLAKMLALQNAGYPVSATVILIGRLNNGRWHSTLGVQTSSGLVMMDSLRPAQTASLGFRAAYYLEMSNAGGWRAAR